MSNIPALYMCHFVTLTDVPNTPLFGAFVRASRTTRSTADAFLKIKKLRSDGDANGNRTEHSHHFPDSVSDIGEGVPTRTPSKLGGQASILVGRNLI